ncbi:hypothetical protein GCK32_010099, partial [Trichostrongylus colubriformis]
IVLAARKRVLVDRVQLQNATNQVLSDSRTSAAPTPLISRTTPFEEDAAVRRRYVKYHYEDEDVIGIGPEHRAIKSKSSDSLDDHRKDHDDYRRRKNEEERIREAILKHEAESFSPYFYMMSLFTLWGIIALLAFVIVHLNNLPAPDDSHVVPRRYSLERKYRVFAAASENIDCSIHMKHISIRNGTSHAVIRHGIMCISMLLPYSSTGMFSTFSMMIYHKQHPEGIVRNSRRGKLKRLEEVSAFNTATLDDFGEVANSLLRMEDGTIESELKQAWFEGDIDTGRLYREWTRHNRSD